MGCSNAAERALRCELVLRLYRCVPTTYLLYQEAEGSASWRTTLCYKQRPSRCTHSPMSETMSTSQTTPAHSYQRFCQYIDPEIWKACGEPIKGRGFHLFCQHHSKIARDALRKNKSAEYVQKWRQCISNKRKERFRRYVSQQVDWHLNPGRWMEEPAMLELLERHREEIIDWIINRFGRETDVSDIRDFEYPIRKSGIIRLGFLGDIVEFFGGRSPLQLFEDFVANLGDHEREDGRTPPSCREPSP